MHPEVPLVGQVADALNAQLGAAPETAIVLGSGLAPVVARCTEEASVAAVEVGLPPSTVAGHAGRIVKGTLGGAAVALVSGRVHLYEGYTPSEVVRYVRALAAWGVTRLVLTNSAGGLSYRLKPGDLVLVSDHINLLGTNPLVGPVYGEGERFPDITQAYDPTLRQVLRKAADRCGVRLKPGVYAAVTGPNYESPAEGRFLLTIGADVVGMSTVPEVLAAAEIGLPTAAIAVVSNLAAGMGGGPVDHSGVTDVAGQAAEQLAAVFEEALGRF